MELEKEIEALILEARDLRFKDNSEEGRFGTFGKVGPKFRQWFKSSETIIYENAGVFSEAWKKFENFDVEKINGNFSDVFDEIKTGIVDILRTLVVKIENESNISREVSVVTSNNEIFIVHGHNDLVKQTIARTLSKLGLEPIILHERPDGGKTIIEKFEQNISNIGFAIILLTNDDEGKAKIETDYKARARQNVIFEMGYFIGKLGRDRVFLLLEHNVEKPGDLDGIVYTPIDTHDGWKLKLVKELKAAGYAVSADNL
jgi:predicted nucleotide-binding protein